MNSEPLIGYILGSAVIGALITALFTRMTADKKARIDNVTKERKAWRDALRLLVSEVNTVVTAKKFDAAKLRVAKAGLMVRLNPTDGCDKAIIQSLTDMLAANNADLTKLEEFNKGMAALLKHDWERAKIETSTPTVTQMLIASGVALTIIASAVTWSVQQKWTPEQLPACVLGLGALVVCVFGLAYGIVKLIIFCSLAILKMKRKNMFKPARAPGGAPK